MSIALFALGAILASFMGVVAARLHTGQSFLTGYSKCDACGVPLAPASLIPIVSYVVLRGRARCCGARISPVAPLSEIVLGGLFVAAYHALGFSIALPLFLVALSLLLALVLYDLAHQILPPGLLYSFVGVSSLAALAVAPDLHTLSVRILVAAGIGGSLAAIHLLSRGRAMGLADAPLAFGLALLTAPVALTGFVFSFWIGAVVGIGLLAGRPRGSRMSSEVPFAPFLASGFLLAYFTQWNLFTSIAMLLR